MSRPEDQIVIRGLHAINTLLARVYHHLEIVSPSHLPRQGAGIVVCNHISPIDPILIQSACRYRLITWMMAKEYMELPVVGRVFQRLDVIPVERGSRETGPLRVALRRLKEGRMVGIFPEGRISTTGNLLSFQTGVALMAARANVPIYPAYLNGSQRNKSMVRAFFERSESVISFGEPLFLEKKETAKESLDHQTARIRLAVGKLRIGVDAYQQQQYL
jgi:1-acyl-sn-glycerol-3-phosphate acyltransferase